MLMNNPYALLNVFLGFFFFIVLVLVFYIKKINAVLEEIREFHLKQGDVLYSLEMQRSELERAHILMVELFRIFYKHRANVRDTHIWATREKTSAELRRIYAQYRMPDSPTTITNWFDRLLEEKVSSRIRKYFGNLDKLMLNHTRMKKRLYGNQVVTEMFRSRIYALVQNHQEHENNRILKQLASVTAKRRFKKTPLSLALLIDCENVNHKRAEEILSSASILGNCKTRRLYGNFQEPGVVPWKEKAESLDMEVIQTHSKANGKNSADATLIVGAMDLLYKRDIEVFVIVSSDTDFTPLVERLRADNKYVLGIGDHYGVRNVYGSLQSACNMFIGTGKIKEMNEDLMKARRALPIVRNALLEVSPNGEWVSSANVKSKMYKSNPGFKQKDYGSKRFLDLVDKMMPEFEVKKVNNKASMRIR